MLHLSLSEVIAIATILITIISTVIAIPRKKLYYHFYSTTLVEVKSKNLPGHTVVIDGKPAKSLIKTIVCFKNGGNRKIDPSDFSDTMPLRITSSEQIFPPKGGYQIEAKDPESINIEIIDEKTLEIHFSYIKAKRDFSFKMLHDGDLSVTGELKTGKLAGSLESLFDKITYILLAAAIFCIFIIDESFFISAYFSPAASTAYIQEIAACGAISLFCILFLIISFASILKDDGIITIRSPFRKKKKGQK